MIIRNAEAHISDTMNNVLAFTFGLLFFLPVALKGEGEEQFTEDLILYARTDMPTLPKMVETIRRLIDETPERYDFVLHLKDEYAEDDAVLSVLAELVADSNLPNQEKSKFLRSFLERENPEQFLESTSAALRYWEGEVDVEILLGFLRSKSKMLQGVAVTTAEKSSTDPKIASELLVLAKIARENGKSPYGDRHADRLEGSAEKIRSRGQFADNRGEESDTNDLDVDSAELSSVADPEEGRGKKLSDVVNDAEPVSRSGENESDSTFPWFYILTGVIVSFVSFLLISKYRNSR